mgnify:CR=1 FL=1
MKFYEGKGEGMECMFKKRAIIVEKGRLNQTGDPSYRGKKVVFHLLQTVKLVKYIMFVLKR